MAYVKRILLIILLISIVESSKIFNISTFDEKYQYYTNSCVKNYFEKYFNLGSSLHGSITVVKLGTNLNDSIIQETLLKVLHNENYYWTMIIYADTEIESNTAFESEDKTRNYLIIVDDINDVESIVGEFKSSTLWNPLAQILIYLIDGEKDLSNEFDEDIKSVGLNLFKNEVLNVYILLHRLKNDTIQIFTFFPYEKGNCGKKIKHIHEIHSCEYNRKSKLKSDCDIHRVDKTEYEDKEKIPNKLDNCLLRVSARPWEPYVIYDFETNTLQGIDIKIVEIISKHLKMNTEITLENRSMYHILQDLVERELDILVGGVDEDPNMSELITSSIPYFQDDMTWCVPKAGILQNLFSFLSLFDLKTWFLIILALILSAIVIVKILYSRKSNHLAGFFKIFMIVSAIVLNQGPYITLPKWSARAFMYFTFFFSFVISAAYQSFLISFLTNPHMELQIKTAEQIYENNLDVTGGVEVVRHLTKSGKIFEYLRRKITICYDTEECLRSLAVNRYSAVAVSRQHAILNPRINRDKMFCFDHTENIYSYLIALIVPKNFHLLSKFNAIIRRIIESGLIEKWIRDLNLMMTINEEITNKVHVEPELALNLKQIEGVFLLHGILLILALFVLIIEIFVHKMTRKSKRLKKFWLILDRFFYEK